jgi:hypothetical protein
VLFTTVTEWIVLVLSVVAALVPEAIISFIVGMFWPSETRKIREKEALMNKDDRKQERLGEHSLLS